LAIFLFFAGLVEFLFAINREVAHFVVAVVGFFAVFYITLTSLPVIYQQCPFQTPLTSLIWYTTRIIAIIFLFPFTRHRAKELWNHVKNGFFNHILSAARDKKSVDRESVQMALGMCRGDDEVEAFLDAVPGYLKMDDNVGTRIEDIALLLNPKGSRMPLGERMEHLLSSCINGDGKMEDAARRHRAITCSHVIFELTTAVSSAQVKGLILDQPNSVGHRLQHLSRDHDPMIAFAASRTIAVLERALLDQLLVNDRMDPKRRAELARKLVTAVGEDDPLSPRYQNGLQTDGNRPDGQLIAVTEFTRRLLLLLSQEWRPSHSETKHIELTFKELCRGLNGSSFSHASQESFAQEMRKTWEAHLASAPPGTLCRRVSNAGSRRGALYPGNQLSSDTHHWAIIKSLESFVSTLNTESIALINSVREGKDT
jgi:hypothetical protein